MKRQEVTNCMTDTQYMVQDDELSTLITKYSNDKYWYDNQELLNEYYNIRNAIVKIVGKKEETSNSNQTPECST